MTDRHDPYSPPVARTLRNGAPAVYGDLRIEGRCLVARREVTLPPICVVSAQLERGAGTTLSRKLYWHSSWIYLLLLVNVILYAIVGAINRQVAHVTYTLSHEARRARNNRRWISTGVLAGGLAMMVLGSAIDAPGVVLAGPLAMIVSFFMYALWCRVVWAHRIEGNFVHLRGISGPAMRAMLAASDRQAQRDDGAVPMGWPAR